MSRERLEVVRLAASAMALVVGTALPPVAWAGNGQPEVAPKADSAAEADAPASDAERAKELAQRGRTLYWNGDYREAIDVFDEAYEIVADPNLLYNISAAYEKLEEYDQALSYLDRYAREAPEEEKDALASRRRELERAKAEAEAAAADPVPADPTQPDGPTEPEGPEVDPGPTDTGQERPKVMGGLGWGLVGVAGAGLAVGAGFGIAALSQTRRGRDACFDDAGSLRCPTSAQDSLEAAQRNAIIADVGFGVAVLATAAALTVLGVRLRARKRDDSRPPEPTVSLDGLGATLRF